MKRLKRQSDFDLVFSKGKRAFSKSVMLVHLSKAGETAIGVSVSKKHGHAVVRNRIKRLLRAAYYPLYEKIEKGHLIIFVPKVAESYSFDVFQTDVRYLLRKENLLSDVE